MGNIDDLPPQNPVLRIEEGAEVAFEEALRCGQLFTFQHRDRRDYGTDYQLELVNKGQRTNLRVHVQLKGTESQPNGDGSVSISILRSNLNYLLTQPSSIYACFNLTDNRLLVRTAEDVLRMYERNSDGGPSWMSQQHVTVRFSETFDLKFQQRLFTSVLENGRGARNRRIAWSVTPPEKIGTLVKSPQSPIPVPLEPPEARILLQHLYKNADDEAISASFEQFREVLDTDRDALDLIYMAEINLGLNKKPFHQDRVLLGITHLTETMNHKPRSRGSLLYTLGNARSALDQHQDAICLYHDALKELNHPSLQHVAAQCWKNFGSALESLNRNDEAKRAYEQALELSPGLAEAHLALSLWIERHGGDLEVALDHLDLVSKQQGSALSMHSVDARRAKLLFQLGEDRQAFQLINSITGTEPLGTWEWKWCAMLVSEHGSKTTASARRALSFWHNYLSHNPNDKHALEEKFHCLWRLHQEGENTGINLNSFDQLAQKIIDSGAADAARIWDRVGHWAQEEGDWHSAEAAYRRAAKLAPIKYGYCLGVALNHLDRFTEAISVLLPKYENCEQDSLSWFQVAFAREHVDDLQGAIDAYMQSLALDPEYALALFNLGGAFLKIKDIENAMATWSEAIRRFPSHELSAKLKKDFPKIFGSPL
jgi:tetratricopeptide (TPR) repeat protein